MASDTTTPIDSLPNEVGHPRSLWFPPPQKWTLFNKQRGEEKLTPCAQILDSILSPLSTQDLIKLAPVNRRIYTIVLRLVQHRLAAVLDQKSSQELILECYPPSAALTTPYLFCDFVETSRLDGSGSTLLDPETELDGSRSNGTLGDLRSLYSRFRPVAQDENRRPRHRYTRQSSGLEDGEAEDAVVPESPPSLDVHLDEGDQFSQLVTVTNVVEMGSRRGQFLGHTNVSDGVLRVWRAWLAAATSTTSAAGGQGEQREAILWADAERHVGVRFRVSRKDAWSQPLLLGADEDPAVSYRLDYEGEFRRIVVCGPGTLNQGTRRHRLTGSANGADLS